MRSDLQTLSRLTAEEVGLVDSEQPYNSVDAAFASACGSGPFPWRLAFAGFVVSAEVVDVA